MRFITSFPHQQAGHKRHWRMDFLQGAIGRATRQFNYLADKALLQKGKIGIGLFFPATACHNRLSGRAGAGPRDDRRAQSGPPAKPVMLPHLVIVQDV